MIVAVILRGGRMVPSFEASFPNISYFVNALGYIEVGYSPNSYLTSFIRAIDEGGMVWEGEDEYKASPIQRSLACSAAANLSMCSSG
jgi:hypothetical protein